MSDGVDEGTSRAAGRRALLVDWGGVLTPPVGQWSGVDGIDPEHLRAVLRAWAGPLAPGPEEASSADVREPAEAGTDWPGAPSTPVHALERGELAVPAFERLLAEELAARGSPVPAAGLVDRLLAPFGGELEPAMVALVREARAAGAAVGLLSNSWGEHYPDAVFAELFDAVVVSGRVGMRKPEPRIFALAAERVGVPAERCVFVDDLQHNVDAARAAGMVAVHHVDVATTAAEVRRLLGLPPGGAAVPEGGAHSENSRSSPPTV